MKFKVKNLKALCILSSVIFISSCSILKENIKGLFGVSVVALEESRVNAIKKTFSRDYTGLYTEALDGLKSIGVYIYTQDIKKKLIAGYVSDTDTTPVGIFFQEIDKNNTQVEVSSPSTAAKEFISNKLFLTLEAKN
jgi:hypothetical protein